MHHVATLPKILMTVDAGRQTNEEREVKTSTRDAELAYSNSHIDWASLSLAPPSSRSFFPAIVGPTNVLADLCVKTGLGRQSIDLIRPAAAAVWLYLLSHGSRSLRDRVGAHYMRMARSHVEGKGQFFSVPVRNWIQYLPTLTLRWRDRKIQRHVEA